MRQALMFKLDQKSNDSGLRCDRDGPFLGREALLRKNGEGNFEAWPPVELRRMFSRVYGDEVDWDSRIRSVGLVATALNKGDIARAMTTAVLMRLPDPAGPVRITDVDGVLEKANFNPDEPRDERGRWTIDGSATSAGSSHRDPRIQLADAGKSDAPDDPVAQAIASAADAARRARAGATDGVVAAVDLNVRSPTTQTNSGGSTPTPDLNGGRRPPPDDEGNRRPEDDGIYAEYGSHIGGVQLASMSIPMGSIGVVRTNPASWENLTRLASGSLELGSGQIIAAADLLSAIDRSRERDAVRSAIAKLGLSPAQAADVLAARAYVWAKTAAPWNFAGVPVSGPRLESASKSIALRELARPGTLYLALHGDRLSSAYLDSAAQDVINDAAVLENRIRLANAPLALQSTSTAARTALKLKPGDNMQAHHLVPVNIIADNSTLAMLASKAGWRTDSLNNLIALPADQRTQARLAATTGIILPIQSSAHPRYDAQTQEEIWQLELRAGGTHTPLDARAILETVAIENRAQIMSGAWYPRLR